LAQIRKPRRLLASLRGVVHRETRLNHVRHGQSGGLHQKLQLSITLIVKAPAIFVKPTPERRYNLDF
jgi:hypothetical protein